MSGREIAEVQAQSVNTSQNLSVKTVEELTYQVRMVDGEAFYLNVTHLSDNSGSGYTSLIVLIGVI